MARLTVVYWRDIPAQVIVKDGRKNAKQELPLRFIEAIDRAAMRSGAAGTDAYLAGWRHGPQMVCGDNLEGEVSQSVRSIDEAYPIARMVILVEAGGFDPASTPSDSEELGNLGSADGPSAKHEGGRDPQ